MKYRNKKSNRKNDTESVKDAIESMLDSYKLRGKFDQTKLIGSWESLMGKPIARRTEKLYVKDKVLFVKLNSAPLRQELTMKKSKVLEIIHENFNKELVVDVLFY